MSSLPPYKLFGRPWQLNIIKRKCREAGINYGTSDNAVICHPRINKHVVLLSQFASSREVGQCMMSRVDLTHDDHGDYLVFNHKILDEAINYATKHNMLDEEFKELSGGCTLVSAELIKLIGYDY